MKKTLKQRSIAIEVANQDWDFNYLKCLEELAELQLVLIQYKTKRRTKSITPEDVINEIGDAKRKIWYLEKVFGVDAVKKRIEDKVKHLEEKKGIKT